jgi:hypothetical protein
VEDIKAENNQVLSVIDLDKKEIAISMLMRAFVFEKALMQEHFNESYIESDIYPKAIFEGRILEFDKNTKRSQTRLIKGKLTIHGVTKDVTIKTVIDQVNRNYVFSGDFEISIDDFKIKVPGLLAPNIAKKILISFRFYYLPYEKYKTTLSYRTLCPGSKLRPFSGSYGYY